MVLSNNRSEIGIDEITPGLVLHLEPSVLVAGGATCTCTEDRRVRGPHWFVCVEINGESGRWWPIYSRNGVGRVVLTSRGRSGHPKWTSSECYYHTGQVWSAPHRVIVAAALVGHDLSTKDCRNRISLSLLPHDHLAA